MIDALNEYQYVKGDIRSVIIDGGIMPVRPLNKKKVLRGEDICFMAEAHEQRKALFDQAEIKVSNRNIPGEEPPEGSVAGGYEEVVLSTNPSVFNFTKKLSRLQLSAVCVNHEIDIQKLGGNQSYQDVQYFFCRRLPNEVMWQGDWDSTVAAIQNEISGFQYGNTSELLQPSNTLNNRKLLSSEVANMLSDSVKFNIPAYGNLNVRDDLTLIQFQYQGMGLRDLSNIVYQAGGHYAEPEEVSGWLNDIAKWWFWNLALQKNSISTAGWLETWPASQFSFAKFKDDGNVETAEYWAIVLYLENNLQELILTWWLSYTKICDMTLVDGWWNTQMSDTSWRSLLRNIFETNTGTTIIDYDVAPNPFVHQYAMKFMCPCVFVQTKDRFKW